MAKRKYSARSKFIGQFPGSKTSVSFSTDIGIGGAVMTKDLAVMFRRVMEETYPDFATRPQLKQIVVTVNLP